MRNTATLMKWNPNSKVYKEYKASLTALSPIQLETSVGLMLGDASLQSQNKGKTFRLKFEWSDKHKEYLNHVNLVFKEWILSDPHKKIRKSPKGNEVITWGLQTISHEAFNPLADLFIKNNVKSIDSELIPKFVTERSLAYWFMDDGGKLDYNKNSVNNSIVLNTQSFTDNEVSMMSKQLAEKFNLETSIRTNKNKKIIVISHNSYSTIKTLINPYIIPAMRYKFP